LPDGVVYVRLKVFQENTAAELRDLLDRAAAETRAIGGIRAVLLDMRNNPGGLLDESVLVSDEFLRSGVIVSTRGRGGQLLAEARAGEAGTRRDYPMVVLVNGYTASAAEIVAGALHDHDRAVVVGTRTFGKGSVQNIIELPDGSALKLTVARYYTPSGRSIQAHGIEPDVVIQQIEPDTVAEAAARTQFREETLEGHLDAEGEDSQGSTAPSREQPRTDADGSDAAPFPDDYQARMAYQTLVAILRSAQTR
jgi:carboxyl-terminal processing protease